MHCPSLNELPPPPEQKTGWPWTVQSQLLPEKTPDGSEWPKITIVTPSYNQGDYVEETIRSVLLQGYPNLEYIIMDGGSNDGSISILEKYSDWISLWRSEKDNGQTHAINKGFEHASGFIRGYLNSDDLLLPNALTRVARLVMSQPGQSLLVLGDCEMGYSPENKLDTWCPTPPKSYEEALFGGVGLCPQPATFWNQLEKAPPQQFNEDLVFSMDYDFWCRLLKVGYKPIKLNSTLAFYRHHPDAKGARLTDVMWSELAGLSLLRLKDVKSFEDKIRLSEISRSRIRHYLRLEIRKLLSSQGKCLAIKSLTRACLSDPGLLMERATLGLARQLLYS
jgi:glycosyltransferase involved in cell wall biosynthesis